jgi:NADPH:quinone reductase-like Zn-dependent oxidoreductase
VADLVIARLANMKAVRIHDFGGPDVLQVEEVPMPSPGPGEVLIRVKAASVNPVDYKTRSGQFKPADLRIPVTLGRDVSGSLEKIGRGVIGVKVGDEVFALLDRDHGGYADYAVAKQEGVVPKPKKLDHVQAAAVPLAALTAWQGLFDHGKLKKGERVLIHGAAGGVGHFAVQFAKNRGAYVVATATAADRLLLRELGADEMIDYHAARFEEHVRDIDLVFDLIAGDTQQRSWKVMKEGGRLISTLAQPSPDEAARHRARGEAFMVEPNRDQLEQIAQLIDDDKITVRIQQTMPLDDVRRAHEHMEHDHVQGKIVLKVA